MARVAKRSQKFFMEQQQALGALNGHVAEMYSGHAVVTAFGHADTSIATFERLNAKCYDGAWKAQFVSGVMMPIMMMVGNLSYVFVAVAGGVLVTRGSLTVGNVQAFIQYSRQFAQPLRRRPGNVRAGELQADHTVHHCPESLCQFHRRNARPPARRR